MAGRNCGRNPEKAIVCNKRAMFQQLICVRPCAVMFSDGCQAEAEDSQPATDAARVAGNARIGQHSQSL
jgi:hypothetical protein